MFHNHHDPIMLRGRLLRYAILDPLHQIDRPLSVRAIAAHLADQGFAVPHRPGKHISDALRWERRRGRVVV